MSSEFELLKQRIIELEAENAELRKEITEISYLRNMSDAEIAELKCRNIEFLRVNEEYNERRDGKINKLEQKNKELETRLAIVEQASLPVEEQSYNNNTTNNSTTKLNSETKNQEK